MNILELATKLKALSTNNTFSINSGSLEAPDLNRLLSLWFGEQPLTIKNATLAESAEQVSIRGASSFFKIPELPVEAVFSISNKQPRLQLTLRPREDWMVTDAFKQLTENDVFNSLVIDGSHLVLDSLENKQDASTDSSEAFATFDGEADDWSTTQLKGWEPKSFTVAWWMKPASLSYTGQQICASLDGDGWGSFAFQTFPAGEAYVGTDTGTRIECPQGTVEQNKWQHFAFVYENREAIFYKDGEIIGVQSKMTKPNPWKGFFMNAPNHMPHGFFKRLTVWGRALSATDIEIHKSQSSLPQAADIKWAPFSNLTCSDAGETIWNFDGKQDSWTSRKLKNWQPDQFTVEWWLKPESLSAWNQLFTGKENEWGAMMFHSGPDGVVYVGTDVHTRITCGAGTIELNTWQHLAFTYDYGKGVFYKNGQAIATKTGMAKPEVWDGFHIGSQGGLLHGQLKGLFIWDHVLDAATIKSRLSQPAKANDPLLKLAPLENIYFDNGFKRALKVLDGTMPLNAVLPGLEELFTEIPQLAITGKIAPPYPDGIPAVCLEGPSLPALKFGEFNLSIQLKAIYDHTKGGYYELASIVDIGSGSKKVSVPISAKFTDYYDAVSFEADLSELTFSKLTELSGIFGDVDFNTLMPPGLSLDEGGLALTQFKMGVNFQEKALESLITKLTIKARWQVSKQLTAELLEADLTIKNPASSRNRMVEALISGRISIGSVAAFKVSLKLPEFVLIGALESNSRVNFLDLVNAFAPTPVTLPKEFPQAYLTEAYIRLNGKQKSLAASIGIEGDWVVIPNILTVTGIGADITVGLDGNSLALAGELSGSLRLCGVDVNVYLILEDSAFTLKGHIPQIPLTDLIKEYLPGMSFPDVLPGGLSKVTLSDITLSITPTKGEFLVEGTCETEWEINDQKLKTRSKISVGRKNKNFHLQLELSVQGRVDLSEDFAFQGLSLAFSYDGAAKSWSVSGDIAAVCFDHALALKASYVKNGQNHQLKFMTSHTAEKPLIEFPGVGSLDYKKVDIAISKDSNGKRAFNLAIDGAVNIGSVTKIAGTLSLFKQANGAFGLIFQPSSKEPTRIRLLNKQGILTEPVDAVIELDGLKSSKTNNEWSFESGTRVSIHGLPKQVNRFVNPAKPDQPLTLVSALRVDHRGAKITLKNPFPHVEFPFPEIDLGGTKFSLGTGAARVSDLSLRLGNDIDLELRMSIALPENLNLFNYVLGLEGSNQIRFKSYDPKKFDETSFDLKVAVGTSGIKGILYSSPLEKGILEFKRTAQATYCHLDLKEIGAFRFMIPEFSLDLKSGSFRAKGGFEVTKPLSLPLAPIKSFLSAMDLKQLSALFPDKLPLKGISIYDEKKKQFKHKELIHILETSGTVPKEVKSALAEAGKYADFLPDALKPYLNIEVPQSLFFDIRITPDSSVKVDISVYDPELPRSQQTDRKPIKALVPTPPKDLIGVQFYGFSIGELWAGSLLLAEVDMVIDRFDLLEMGAAVALSATGADKAMQIGSSKNLKQRYIIDKLFMPIIYQTGVPIPIPLFYNQLGLEFATLIGGAFQRHIGFPLPKINAMELIKGITNLKRFITDKEYLLNPAEKPKDLDFKLQLPDNYLQLPDFLGGGVLGNKGNLEFSAYEIAAHALNFCKKPSVNRFIKLIPLEKRVGSFETRTQFRFFGVFTFESSSQWLLTTPQEFRDGAWKKLNSTQGKDGFLSLVPKSSKSASSPDQEGFVAFLQGGFEIGSVAYFDTAFVQAISDDGFATAFRIEGALGDVFTADLSGAIAVAPGNQQQPIAVSGSGSLTFCGKEILSGSLSMNTNGLAFSGSLDLFPHSKLIRIAGDVSGSIRGNGFNFQGDVSCQFGFIELRGAALTISNQEFAISGTFLGLTVTLAIQQKKDAIRFFATLNPVNLASVFKITDATDETKGPSLSIELGQLSYSAPKRTVAELRRAQMAPQLSAGWQQKGSSPDWISNNASAWVRKECSPVTVPPTTNPFFDTTSLSAWNPSGNKFKAQMSGSVSLLGMKRTTDITFTDKGFSTTVGGNFLGVLGSELTLEVETDTSAGRWKGAADWKGAGNWIFANAFNWSDTASFALSGTIQLFGVDLTAGGSLRIKPSIVQGSLGLSVKPQNPGIFGNCSLVLEFQKSNVNDSYATVLTIRGDLFKELLMGGLKSLKNGINGMLTNATASLAEFDKKVEAEKNKLKNNSANARKAIQATHDQLQEMIKNLERINNLSKKETVLQLLDSNSSHFKEAQKKLIADLKAALTAQEAWYGTLHWVEQGARWSEHEMKKKILRDAIYNAEHNLPGLVNGLKNLAFLLDVAYPIAKAIISAILTASRKALAGVAKSLKDGVSTIESMGTAALNEVQKRTGQIRTDLLAAQKKYNAAHSSVEGWINSKKSPIEVLETKICTSSSRLGGLTFDTRVTYLITFPDGKQITRVENKVFNFGNLSGTSNSLLEANKAQLGVDVL